MKTLQCANCAKPMGEIEKGRLKKDLRYICQKCLDGLFNDRLMLRNKPEDPMDSLNDIFKGFKE